MDWPEIIAEGFLGTRDGEPPDLRRDIADELNDHLACAMQRELRRTDEPGKLNTWTITLPDPVLKAVREYVAEESMPASRPAS